MAPRFQRGDLLLVALTFSSQTGVKKRPVLVLRDAGDADLLVVPVTSQTARVEYDLAVKDWQQSGLKLPSVVRVEKLSTVEKTTVVRKIGKMSQPDWQTVEAALRKVFAEVIAL